MFNANVIYERNHDKSFDKFKTTVEILKTAQYSITFLVAHAVKTVTLYKA